MLPNNRPPTHPGEALLEDFLKPLDMTQLQLAAKTGMPIQRINTLINGKRGMTAETAILLSGVLGTEPDFWMALQAQFDLWHAEKSLASRKKPARRRQLADA
ncbi:MAG TPA: HigA family addiction module antitoxin [Polyangiaceae bacterium]|nr:HigA family addiction module antitoxin [Polyangiaceae bacterium]